MNITYFISYRAYPSPNEYRAGRCDVVLKQPISSLKQIEEIESALSREHGVKVVVDDWKRFEAAETICPHCFLEIYEGE